VTELPKRVPGDSLRHAIQGPEVGWFGSSVQWPTDDPDASAALKVLSDAGIGDSPETVTLLHRVLNGVHQLGTHSSTQKGRDTA